MNRLVFPVIAAAALAFGGLPAHADGKGKHKKHHAEESCPPGLAKKSPACVPPGLAKGQGYDDDDQTYMRRYRVGDPLGLDRVYVERPSRYGLPDGSYYVSDGYLYRVNPDTMKVIALLGLAQSLLN